MRLAWTIVYVPDVPAALAFWERAFGFSRAFLSDDGDYGELATGDTTLAFASAGMAAGLGAPVTLASPEAPAPGIELALATEDVEAGYARAVEAGATPVKPPTAMPWGQVVSYVRDPNGVLVEICTPIEPAAG